MLCCRDRGEATCQPPAFQAHDDQVLRMQYSMVIVRLVNGIADSGQKGRTANSVASIAAGAGAASDQPAATGDTATKAGSSDDTHRYTLPDVALNQT